MKHFAPVEHPPEALGAMEKGLPDQSRSLGYSRATLRSWTDNFLSNSQRVPEVGL